MFFKYKVNSKIKELEKQNYFGKVIYSYKFKVAFFFIAKYEGDNFVIYNYYIDGHKKFKDKSKVVNRKQFLEERYFSSVFAKTIIYRRYENLGLLGSLEESYFGNIDSSLKEDIEKIYFTDKVADFIKIMG